MKYDGETIISFVLALLISVAFICVSAFDDTFPLWSDLAVRLGGAIIVLIIGFTAGFYKGKAGADDC